MKIIFSLLISVIFSLGVFSAPVCTLDENGNYSCSYELPDTETIVSYNVGTYELIINERNQSVPIIIDADLGYISFKGKTTKLEDEKISNFLDSIYSITEVEDGDVEIKISSSDDEDIYFKTDKNGKKIILKMIDDLFSKSGN